MKNSHTIGFIQNIVGVFDLEPSKSGSGASTAVGLPVAGWQCDARGYDRVCVGCAGRFSFSE
jgi:hypothetical protein